MGIACSQDASVPTSTTWDRYEKIRILGQGASASVWLARPKKGAAGMQSVMPSESSSHTPSLVALKSLHKGASFSRQVYTQESHILKMLKHPNILEFVEAFESQYELVIVTQYLSGGEMFDRLQTLHHYDEKTAAKLAKKMLQALYYCHKHDIVHRDLKPENYCFVNESEDSELKLIDFGEALHIGDEEVHDNGVGTPHYVAPEIVDNKFPFPRTGKVLKGADVWSLGVIFYMMLTGYLPYDGFDDVAIMENAMRGGFEWSDEFQVSQPAKDLVSKMLTYDHTKRITVAEALNHPWIANPESNSGVSLAQTLKAIKDYSTSALMKKAVANILIKEMTKDESTKLHQLFDELDTDGDHVLDLHELTIYMQQHGYDKKDEAAKAAKAFIEAVDQHKRGTITYEDFEKAHMQGLLGSDAVAIRKAFDAIDTDKDGLIDVDGVRALLGEETAKTFADLFTQSGIASDGKVSFKTFLQAMTSENLKDKSQAAQERMRHFLTVSRRSLISFASIESVDVQHLPHTLRLSAFGPSATEELNSRAKKGIVNPHASEDLTKKTKKQSSSKDLASKYLSAQTL